MKAQALRLDRQHRDSLFQRGTIEFEHKSPGGVVVARSAFLGVRLDVDITQINGFIVAADTDTVGIDVNITQIRSQRTIKF